MWFEVDFFFKLGHLFCFGFSCLVLLWFFTFLPISIHCLCCMASLIWLLIVWRYWFLSTLFIYFYILPSIYFPVFISFFYQYFQMKIVLPRKDHFSNKYSWNRLMEIWLHHLIHLCCYGQELGTTIWALVYHRILFSYLHFYGLCLIVFRGLCERMWIIFLAGVISFVTRSLWSDSK